MIISYTKTIEHGQLQKTAEKLTGNWSPMIVFSIFKDLDDDFAREPGTKWLVRAPDIESTEPVIEGDVVFFINYWRFGDEPVCSEKITNPTWRDIIRACDDLMIMYSDGDGIFLEGIRSIKDSSSYKLSFLNEPGINYQEFIIGS